MRNKSFLLEEWQRQPQKLYRLILRVSTDLAEAEALLKSKGIEVRRRLALIQSLSIVCTGAQAIELVQEPWVITYELDKEVSACS